MMCIYSVEYYYDIILSLFYLLNLPELWRASLRILVIDTATESLVLLRFWNEGVVASRFEISPREHTQKFYQW